MSIMCGISGHIKEFEDIVFSGGLIGGGQVYHCRRCNGFYYDTYNGMDIDTYELNEKGIMKYLKAINKKRKKINNRSKR